MGITELIASFKRYLDEKNVTNPHKAFLTLDIQVAGFQAAVVNACQKLSDAASPSLNGEILKQVLIESVLTCMPGRFAEDDFMCAGPGSTISVKAPPFNDGVAAWSSAHDYRKISRYIFEHVGAVESYHYLCAFYKTFALHPEFDYCQNDVLRMINELGGQMLALVDFDQKAALTPDEYKAFELVNFVHPGPSEIAVKFPEFLSDVAKIANTLDLSVTALATNFCCKVFTQGILLHSFSDGNYRSLSVLVNALLDRAGYEFIDFYNAGVRSVLALPFGAGGHDKAVIAAVLGVHLVHKPVLLSAETVSPHAVLFQKLKTTDPGRAIRRAAANGYEGDLLELIKQFPKTINEGNKTALDWAIEKDHQGCIDVLREHGAVQKKMIDGPSA